MDFILIKGDSAGGDRTERVHLRRQHVNEGGTASQFYWLGEHKLATHRYDLAVEATKFEGFPKATNVKDSPAPLLLSCL